MLISLNELKRLVDVKIPDDELFRLIGSRLVEIEHVEDLASKYKKIYIVKVKSAEPIEGTHLHLCQIDAGKELNAEVDPEHDGYIQVVCGAPNVKKGMLAVWIAPGAIVPATFNDAEPFAISARPLRGFMSHGMLAAADELALGDDHAGIISICPDHVVVDEKDRLRAVRPGDSFAMAFDLNDKIIEVENKSLTHRPDCFGLIGFAREIAGILGQKFDFKERAVRPVVDGTPAPLSVKISDYKICPRYEAYAVDLGGGGFDKYVPMHFESEEPVTDFFKLDDVFFAKAGMRSVSPLVDLTNKIMLMTGQPLHAFDYDKFVKVGGTDQPEIRVRLARSGEKLTLLDDKEIALNETDIVICSGDTPVALAGAMGGKSTAIDETTQKVIFEIASFSLYNLRKTQMSHGIFSEAITRFTKGRPATDLAPARHMLLDELNSFFASSKLIAAVTDTDPALLSDGKFSPNLVKITAEEINALLGTDYSEELIIKTLENTGFVVTSKNSALEITVPLWRADIHIKEDIIEEVGRLLGFDNIPFAFPAHPFVCPTVDPMFELKSKLRTCLSERLGMNEVLTYSFVSKSLQEKAGENPDDSYQITNSISPELECFRQSLLPSLLDKTRENEKAGFKDFSLYELNQVSRKSWGLTDENVPKMQTELALTTFGDFYRAKQVLMELEKFLNLAFELKPLETSTLFEPLHAAAIYLNNEKIGELGEVKSTVLRRFKLGENAQLVSALQLTLDPCLGAEQTKKFGIKLSKFPFVSRDLTFRVPREVNYADVEAKITQVLNQISGIIYKLEPVSIYQKETADTKNLSFHLEIASREKTLASSEVSDIIETIVKESKTLGAEVV